MSKSGNKSTLVGHEARFSALARAFAKDRVPQTLLVSGPPHVGKWTLVREYSKLLLCAAPVMNADGIPAPCGACTACHQVDIETYPDFQVFRPLVSSAEDERDWVIAPEMMQGSILSIHVARKFAGEAMKRPMNGPRKVMVLVQADRMNDEAQNCLLKTFEEPIPGLSIFLICDNADHLKATIRSRCWHMPLGLASDSAINQWLGQSTPATPDQIEAAVRVAAGRPGAAWREVERLRQSIETGEQSTPRIAQAEEIAERIVRARPVAALGLTEEALRIAKLWWEEDLKTGEEKSDLKKADAKVVRSSVVRFLDELSIVYQARWQRAVSQGAPAQSTPAHDPAAVAWSDGLDQIRKTRHYILRNANTNLALDVLFGRLIAAQRASSRRQ
jgi:DNA polymerase-3 subunit delta'